MIIFLFIIIAIFSLIHGYVAHKFIPRMAVSTSIKILLWTLIFILALAPLVPSFLNYWNYENSAIDSFALFGFTSLGFFAIAFSFLLVIDLLVLCWTLIIKAKNVLPGIFNKQIPVIKTIDLQRRDFIFKAVHGSVVVLAAGLTGYGFFNARKGPDIIKVSVPIKNCPPGLEGLRIVQLSDIHVGPTIKRDYVQHVVDQVKNLNPDLLVITGDLVDGSVDYLSQDVDPLSDLSAPLGKYFCTGNHEYYAGVHHWLEKIEELGYRTLINEHIVLDVNGDKLCLAGVTDITAGYRNPEHATDPALALSGAPPDSLKVLLAHQPGSIFEASRLGVDLQLSGHTHGGQFFPFNLGVKLAHKYSVGLHNHEGTWIYVNRGTGYWGPPLRLGIPSEITVITLEREH